MDKFKNIKDLSEQELKEYDRPDKIISSYEMMIELQNKPTAQLSVKSNIPSLDKYTGGFEAGELIVISGQPKSGKTLLGQTLTVQFCKQQYTPLWFSFEVPAKQFLNQFRELPLFYMPSKLEANAMSWLKTRCAESFLKYHTRIIFIDHLHFLFDLARSKSPSIDIGQVVRELKTLAIQKEYIIFLLCHTTKGGREDDISYEKIRDSGLVACESDTVFMIGRTPKDGDTAARLRVEFHRRTGVLEKVVKLHRQNGYLVETEDESKGE
jgi:replicative DNA helicase